MFGRRATALVVSVATFAAITGIGRASGVEQDMNASGPNADALTGSATLAQEVTDRLPARGETMSVSSVGPFDPDGGWALIDPPAPTQELFYYLATDPTTNELKGIHRPEPAAHPAGSEITALKTDSLMSGEAGAHRPVAVVDVTATQDHIVFVALSSLDGFDPAGGFALSAAGRSSQQLFYYAGTDAVTSSITAVEGPDPTALSTAASVQGVDLAELFPVSSVPAQSSTTSSDVSFPIVVDPSPVGGIDLDPIIPSPPSATIDPPNLCTVTPCDPPPTTVDPPPVGGIDLDPLIPDPPPRTVDPPPLCGQADVGVQCDPSPIRVTPPPVYICCVDPSPISTTPPPIQFCCVDPDPVVVDPPPVTVPSVDPAPLVVDPPPVTVPSVDPDPLIVDPPPAGGGIIDLYAPPVCTPEIVVIAPPVPTLDPIIIPSLPPLIIDPSLPPIKTGAESSSVVGELTIPPICVDPDPPPVSVPSVDPDAVVVDPPAAGGVTVDHPPVTVDAPPVGGITVNPAPVTVDPPPVPPVSVVPPPVYVDPPGVPPVAVTPTPIVVDPPNLCTVTSCDPSPIVYDPPDPCASNGPAQNLLDPCYVPIVDPSPVTVDPPPWCNTAGVGIQCDPSPVPVRPPDPCQETNPGDPGNVDPCYVPIVDPSPIVIDCKVDSISLNACPSPSAMPSVPPVPVPVPPLPCAECFLPPSLPGESIGSSSGEVDADVLDVEDDGLQCATDPPFIRWLVAIPADRSRQPPDVLESRKDDTTRFVNRALRYASGPWYDQFARWHCLGGQVSITDVLVRAVGLDNRISITELETDLAAFKNGDYHMVLVSLNESDCLTYVENESACISNSYSSKNSPDPTISEPGPPYSGPYDYGFLFFDPHRFTRGKLMAHELFHEIGRIPDYYPAGTARDPTTGEPLYKDRDDNDIMAKGNSRSPQAHCARVQIDCGKDQYYSILVALGMSNPVWRQPERQRHTNWPYGNFASSVYLSDIVETNPTVLCDGLAHGPTHGTETQDSYTGDASENVISLLDENDFAQGNDGGDALCGGDGKDELRGGGGADAIVGGGGPDMIYGGDGNDRIYDGHGADYIDGGPGYDTLYRCDTDNSVVADSIEDTEASSDCRNRNFSL